MFSLFGFVIVKKSKLDSLIRIADARSRLKTAMRNHSKLSGDEPENSTQDLFSNERHQLLRNKTIVTSVDVEGVNTIVTGLGCLDLSNKLRDQFDLSFDNSNMSRQLRIGEGKATIKGHNFVVLDWE